MPIEFHEGAGTLPAAVLEGLYTLPYSTRMAYFAARVATHLTAYKETP